VPQSLGPGQQPGLGVEIYGAPAPPIGRLSFVARRRLRKLTLVATHALPG
jgi:hypothetical protein